MWTYSQSTGKLLDSDGNLVATGYSGFGPGRNNPTAQGIHNVGPIPQGLWVVGTMVDMQHFGPTVMRLTPAPGTNALGRDGFLIHGDSAIHPGYASHGCIILPGPARQKIGLSKDRALEVTA